ncbi:VlmB-like protein [Streptomyces sp. GbtcB6]|uniref:VlmB-like protein n=1 Tax=Streptomyces sp. GbtcB6 TaxID=2824751 RepID=UPI001C2F6823|nr:VlmB-like protein [Streptomyces sp. GbtcB6]
MTTDIPLEADWDRAPNLLDGAQELTLTAGQCDLAYWLSAVAQGTLRGRARRGHATTTPPYMREPGPLREALVLELGNRSLSELRAVQVLSHYVIGAPGPAETEFFVTQVVDEARHSMVFRNHLLELGVPAERLHEQIAQEGADYTKRILDPISEFATSVVRDEGDFIGAVAVFTIVIEGVLAPAAELSERKWGLLDRAAAEIARGASIDEIRHLAVGSSIVREHLARHPEYRPRLIELVRRGRRLWDELPVDEFVLHREHLFQEGMAAHTELLADYEVFPGRRLLETTAEERYDLAERWTDDMARARLPEMGIPEAVDIIVTGH